MSIAPGTSVGPYDILAPIGAGGMGEVYRARDRRLGREVALKVLPAGKLANQDRKQRFIQEAKTASALNHPNIVTIYDIGSQDGVEYIAMEFIKGRTLDELIPEKGLRLNETLRISIAVADALAKAHGAGIIHRDLKPANVMVTEDGQIKLLDFGLAKLVDPGLTDSDNTQSIGGAQTMEGTILGTVSYMSPEQAKGYAVDARSDIFSFGALVYEMITGRRAFKSDSPVATLSAILTEDPVQISAVTANVPSELERVIARCLRKEPEKRWQNMKDVKVALQELKEESDSGTLLTGRMPALPEVRKQRSHTGIFVGICAVLLCCGAIAYMLARQSHVDVAPAVASSVAAPETLTNESIIQLVNANVGIPIIMAHIRESKTDFDLSTPELIRLAKAGVPEPVIEQMRNPKAAVRPDLPRAAPKVVETVPGVPVPEPKPAAAPPPPPAAPATAAAKVKIEDGERVMLVVAGEEFVSQGKTGDQVHFAVRDDVRVGNSVVVQKGAIATAIITATERKRLIGKGKLAVRFDYVTAVDGQHLPIRGTPQPQSLGRSVPLANAPTDLVIGLPVFIAGPVEVALSRVQ